jgi:hypothetical protein
MYTPIEVLPIDDLKGELAAVAECRRLVVSSQYAEAHCNANKAKHSESNRTQRIHVQLPGGVRTAVLAKNPQHFRERKTKIRNEIPLLSLAVNLSDHHRKEHVRQEHPRHSTAEREDPYDCSRAHLHACPAA